jgi:hypothetical protein
VETKTPGIQRWSKRRSGTFSYYGSEALALGRIWSFFMSPFSRITMLMGTLTVIVFNVVIAGDSFVGFMHAVISGDKLLALIKFFSIVAGLLAVFFVVMMYASREPIIVSAMVRKS